MATKGYRKERFPGLQGEIFDCFLCKNIVKSPKQCSSCGNLFCGQCIDQFIKINGICPQGCLPSIVNMTAKALIKIYNDLDIKCQRCPKNVKLGDLARHQELCGRPKCQFHESCSGFESKSPQFKPFCSQKCKLLNSLIECNGDNKKVYEILSKFVQNTKIALVGNVINNNVVHYNNGGDKIVLKWSNQQCGMGIVISNDNTSVFLKQQAYVFRSVVVKNPFMSGRHYWQIYADSRTQNELKIGVTSTNNFEFNTAFCDHKFGYAYYGLGQLRHGSNATGQQYGKRFKKAGILGVYLNMDRGTLSFSLNGEDFGIAYEDAELKKGPLYATVALLHCSGCTISGELPIPPLFQNK